MANSNIIILTGPAASGKSTIAKMMTDQPVRDYSSYSVRLATEYAAPGKTYILDGANIENTPRHHELFKQMKRHNRSRYVVTTNIQTLPPWVYQYAQVWKLNPIKA